jgi:ferredoxin
MLTMTLATLPFVPLLELILEPFTVVDSEYNSSQYARRLHTLPHRRVWPRSIKSVLPHGPEGTVRALSRILATDITAKGREHVYTAFCRMLQLCSPLVAPLLIRSSFFARHAISPMRDLRLEPESHVQGKLDSRHNTKVMACIQAFVDLMSEIVVRSTSEAERVAFHGLAPSSTLATYAYCIDVCQTVQALVNAPSARKHYQEHRPTWLPIVNPAIQQLAILGAKLCGDYPSVVQAEMSIAARRLVFERLRSNLSSSTETEKQIRRFVLLMHHLEVRQRCGAPGCAMTRADGRLRCCTGCRRVMYCSKACQKAAWRHTIAHRDVCQVIELLCVTMGVPEQGIFDLVNIEEGVWELPVDPTHKGLYHQVISHFANLTMHELETSRECMLPIFDGEDH